MAHLNSVVQIIVQEPGGAAYERMVAGTGWFPDTKQCNVPVGTLLTNAHVVRNAQHIFIRLPAAHQHDVPVGIRGISGDLDLAVLYLNPPQLKEVQGILKDRYDTSAIPTIRLADSDAVHPHRFDNLKKIQNTYARGYPLGTEYQMFTKGVVSGLKHTRNQVYIVTTSTINSGNSGGPCVLDNGDSIGINSMKLVSRGVEEINMVIPSNRILRTLPMLMDNSKNINAVRQALARMLFEKQLKGAAPTSEQVSQVNSLMEPIEDVDYTVVVSNWNQHNCGGFKRVQGIVSPVTISDWFTKHVQPNHNGHKLFEHVFTHLHNNEVDKVHEMRKLGFKNYYCTDCAEETACKPPQMMNVAVPPRTVHLPTLGFRFSPSTGEQTLKYYGNPENVKSGVIISSLSVCGILCVSGVLCGDLLYGVNGCSVDNFGEMWDDVLNVSVRLLDVLCVGVSVLSVIGVDGVKRSVVLKDSVSVPHIRVLDNVLDASTLGNERVLYRGVEFKTLRLNDVFAHKMTKYYEEETHHLYRIMVCNIKVGSAAYQQKHIRPGDVLSHIGPKQAPTSWKDFIEVLSAHTDEQPLHLTMENSKIIIL